jgi:hypothetical protein
MGQERETSLVIGVWEHEQGVLVGETIDGWLGCSIRGLAM